MGQWHVLVDETEGTVIEASTSEIAADKVGLRLTLPGNMQPWGLYWTGSEWFQLPGERPSKLHRFNRVAGVWTDTRTATEIAEAEKRAFDDAVNAERERRVESGFLASVTGYSGTVTLTGRASDREYMHGKFSAATLAEQSGVTDPIIGFIDGANVRHQFTPLQFRELWSAAMAWIDAIYYAGRDIKDADPRPVDPTDDALWPAS